MESKLVNGMPLEYIQIVQEKNAEKSAISLWRWISSGYNLDILNTLKKDQSTIDSIIRG